MEGRSDRFTAIEDRYAGYTVYDTEGDKIGKVDDLFVDENDQPEYHGVKLGLLGTSSTLIPWQMVEVRETDSSLIVSADDSHVKDGPTFDDDRDITPEFESEVYSYYGLQQSGSAEDRGTYSDYYGDSGEVGPGMREGDTETGEFRGHAEDNEGVSQSAGSDLEDEDELRVQRSEEELRAGTREREAGSMRVRKRVRTDRASR
jgi:sporulation protein YlmC with PRC-barrel domain